jgi:hypothetical protein
MAELVTQPSANPTNKLTAATVTGFIVAFIQFLVTQLAPQYAGILQDPTVVSIETTVAAFIAGWIVKDRATMVVVR